jgi:hypothetical protein
MSIIDGRLIGFKQPSCCTAPAMQSAISLSTAALILPCALSKATVCGLSVRFTRMASLQLAPGRRFFSDQENGIQAPSF